MGWAFPLQCELSEFFLHLKSWEIGIIQIFMSIQVVFLHFLYSVKEIPQGVLEVFSNINSL